MENKTEWAGILNEENQLTRGIYNYILHTFEGVKGSEFDSAKGTFKLNSYNEFLNEIITVSEHLKEQNTTDLEELIEDLKLDGVEINN